MGHRIHGLRKLVEHTLSHALNPETCSCSSRQIERCVICGRPREKWHGDHVDTCGGRCFRRLLEMQRRAADRRAS